MQCYHGAEVTFRVQIREVVTRKALELFRINVDGPNVFLICRIFTFARYPNDVALIDVTYTSDVIFQAFGHFRWQILRVVVKLRYPAVYLNREGWEFILFSWYSKNKCCQLCQCCHKCKSIILKILIPTVNSSQMYCSNVAQFNRSLYIALIHFMNVIFWRIKWFHIKCFTYNWNSHDFHVHIHEHSTNLGEKRFWSNFTYNN